jgi:hypothetical protein
MGKPTLPTWKLDFHFQSQLGKRNMRKLQQPQVPNSTAITKQKPSYRCTPNIEPMMHPRRNSTPAHSPCRA